MNSFTKLTILLLIVAGSIHTATAQLYKEIGDNPYILSSQSIALELNSSTKGFLPPRMTTAERDHIDTAAKGLLIYNITTNSIEVNTGTPGSPTWKTASVTANPGIKIVTANYTATDADYTVLSDPSVDASFSDQPDHIMSIRLPENTELNPNVVASGKIYVIGKTDETDKPLNIFPPLWLSKTTTSVNRINIPTLFRVQYDGTKWCIID